MRLVSVLKIGLIIISLSLLSGCKFYKDSAAWKKPLPGYLIANIKSRGFEVGARILARMYKKENRFEVWMEKNGRFYFFKSYSICSWSGKLGPKLKTGDNQAPEGYYVVTPAQMNPRSKYYLSFNLGYPNFYDRSLGRTGAHLMVHGECSSRGCYALTNSSIEEVYLLARDAFKNGQRNFHVHAYPFKLTEYNLEKYKDNKWIDFWRNLAEGDKLFKQTGQPLKMSVANKRYIFAPMGEPFEKPITSYATIQDNKTFTLPEVVPQQKWDFYSNQNIEQLFKQVIYDVSNDDQTPEKIVKKLLDEASKDGKSHDQESKPETDDLKTENLSTNENATN